MTTLKNLVDETTMIKDELVTCHRSLKNNLVDKGVECSDTDKMSSLIDKVGDISGYTFSQTETELDVTFEKIEKSMTFSPTTLTTYCTFKEVDLDGYYTVSMLGRNYQNQYPERWGIVYIYVNDIEKISFQFNGSDLYYENKQLSLKRGDIVSIKGKAVNSGGSQYYTYMNESLLKAYMKQL